MKSILLCLVVITSCFALSVSCTKKGDGHQGEIITCAPCPKYLHQPHTISNTETFSFDMGSFTDKDKVTIYQQGKHYTLSTADRQESNVTYRYQALPDYVGADTVMVDAEYAPTGNSTTWGFKRLIFTFTINKP